ncbi:hypothetical protein F4861DRAFT_422564 [Xylaria intraflava]|nr:hypothetical protein F4861DRAFT_422564 [Xylaria intraflava]
MMSSEQFAHAATLPNTYQGESTAQGPFINDNMPCSDSELIANTTVKPTSARPPYQKNSRPTVDMTRYPSSGYIRDSSLLSWMASLPVAPVAKSYSWSNEATILFILTLCEAGRAGLIDPRFFAVHKQNRVRMWEYVRQRFCESGLYALVPGLTDAVLENKYKSEIYEVFKPYKKLVSQQHSDIGFDMDAAGQFTAPDEAWEHHFSIKGNSKDAWLRQRGMPLWAQYEEAFGEDVATGELAQAVRERERASWNKYPRTLNNINPLAGPPQNVFQQREQEMTPFPIAPEPSYTPARFVEATREVSRSAKRRRETASSAPDVQGQMAATLQTVSNSVERIESMLNKQDDQKLKAYSAIRRLKLGKDVEKAARTALENAFNVIDVLELDAEKDEAGLRKWCLDNEKEVAASPITLELIITPSRSTETMIEAARLVKRRRETASSVSDVHTRTAETQQEASNSTMDRLEAMLTKRADQKLKAYAAIRRLKLGKDVERAAKKALENELNVVDVLEFEAEKDEEGLREWCLEIGWESKPADLTS